MLPEAEAEAEEDEAEEEAEASTMVEATAKEVETCIPFWDAELTGFKSPR